jgi:iduronate 2-sulfatase
LSGKSLRPVLESPQKNKWKKPAVTLVWYGKSAWGYTLRNERYRYMEWMEGKEGKELYDHSMDPKEVTNLADDSTFSEITALLSKQLESYVPQAPHLRNP